jgi:peptidoglycan/xylan/chitin deacetylase (PgdA/CDA1 family)
MFKKLVLPIIILIALIALLPAALNAAPTNLINNPSVETASGSLPTGWNQGNWGTNTTAFTYKTTEGNTGTKSLYANMTARTSGDAKWYFSDVAVKPSQKYTYSEFYKSNVATEVDVQYTDTTGKLSYGFLSAPAVNATAWKPASTSFTTPANVKTLTIFHVINKVGWVQTDDFSLVEGDGTVTPPAATPPSVAFSAPAANATISGTQTVSANASDSVGVAGVQFKIDGVNIGSEDTTAPYSLSWDSKTVANGNHTLSAVARNTSGLTSTATETVNINNPTPPSVSFSAPVSAATVSGKTVVVSANASDGVGVSGVQFKLDGNNLGAEDTTAPYGVNWDTTAVANGNHTLTAVARNGANLTATATETVNVQNAVVTPPASTNLIPNPSLETTNGTAPASWLSSNWGTNTTTFSYLNTGHAGSHSLKVESTAYTNGAANWYYADVPVSSGKTYKYENWYQSNVDTEVDAEVVMNDGTTQYYWLGAAFASPTPTWAKYSGTFTVPAGAKSLAIYQILAKTGYIVSDDYSLSEYTPLPLNRGLVSITFDDGWTNQYTNAFPLLKQYGLPATFYIISGELTDQPDYMSATQVKNLQVAGNEIGSHTITHPDLTTVSATQLQNEMKNSQATLQSVVGVPITNFAYPYGAYNANTIAVGKQYYQSQRSVGGGLNTKDSLNLTQLKIQEVDSNISQAQVQGWINAAIAQKAWLILVYHEIATTPVDPTDALYTTQPADINAELAYLKNSGVTVLTVNQAINEITPQL